MSMKLNELSVERFEGLTERYPALRVAVLGDFCLDRYLEIDPAKAEVSIETGLPVHNVVRVRAQPGAAGTIVNNLVALGVGILHPIGFCGVDGEGFELRRALESMPGVRLDAFVETEDRRTFTYCKPLLVETGQAPRELSRLDTKNWSVTPEVVERRLIRNLEDLAGGVDAIVVLDQVDQPGTGVVTAAVLAAVGRLSERCPLLWILADSRRGLGGYPSVCFKMNRVELARLMGGDPSTDLGQAERWAVDLARRQRRHVFVTLSEAGMLGAAPGGELVRMSTWPVRGEIDIVGAGDAVTANLTSALGAGADLKEALQLANAAASIVIHQLGTTGTASVAQLRELMFGARLREGDEAGSMRDH
jgi:rfaE bifunctional protein kinase chain/domain